MAVATTSEIIEKLESIDLNTLLNRMEIYVRDRFYDKSERNKQGFQFQDFCHCALSKACDGTRKWRPSNCTFENFVFGVLKSDLDSFFKKQKRRSKNSGEGFQSEFIIDILYNFYQEPSENDVSYDKIDDEVRLQQWIQELKAQGADKDELDVFECWAIGIHKAKDIAEYIDKPIDQVYTIHRKLKRRKIKLNEKWTSLSKK